MSENIYYTYAWLRENKTPYYIGKGKNKRAWRKGSPPEERVLILKRNLSESEALNHEKYMIAVFGRKDAGTGILHNFTDGGEGVSGIVRSEETRRKLSEAMTGKNHSPETRKKISESQLGGKRSKPSEETKRKMSESSTGKVHTPETRKKISNSCLGRPSPRKGKKLSEETRKKISEAAKLREAMKRIDP